MDLTNSHNSFNNNNNGEHSNCDSRYKFLSKKLELNKTADKDIIFKLLNSHERMNQTLVDFVMYTMNMMSKNRNNNPLTGVVDEHEQILSHTGQQQPQPQPQPQQQTQPPQHQQQQQLHPAQQTLLQLLEVVKNMNKNIEQGREEKDNECLIPTDPVDTIT